MAGASQVSKNIVQTTYLGNVGEGDATSEGAEVGRDDGLCRCRDLNVSNLRVLTSNQETHIYLINSWKFKVIYYTTASLSNPSIRLVYVT